MFQKLVSRNDDLARLVRRGYAVAFDSNCLIIRDIPYLDEKGELQAGALVAKLEFVDQERVIQTDHQVYFAGAAPYGADGKPIPNLGGGRCTIALSASSADVVVHRSFSNKPIGTGRYDDFFHKIETYVAIISGPAVALHPDATPLTFRVKEQMVETSVFKFHDTLTTRAGLGDLAPVFRDDVVAVIGTGGTGSYIVDFLVKTPVREIRAFDHDTFHVHNAFRSPGRLEERELGEAKAKVYQNRYENFRHGLTVKWSRIDATSADEFRGVTFAFVSVDKGSSRAEVFELLIRLGIPFIDVGMGLSRKHGPLSGMARVTYFAPERAAEVRELGLAQLADSPEDLYRDNIQISELNALNASLAVIKFKQLRGFYFEAERYHHAVFGIEDASVTRL
jgi:Domain of unknown function (DUF6791)/ThiF family